MKTFLLSLVLAVLTEALLVTACLKFGGMGPCGPTNNIAGITLLLHSPGIMLASALGLPGDLSAVVAVIVGIGSVIFGFTMLYFVILTGFKLFWPRANNPGVPNPE